MEDPTRQEGYFICTYLYHKLFTNKNKWAVVTIKARYYISPLGSGRYVMMKKYQKWEIHQILYIQNHKKLYKDKRRYFKSIYLKKWYQAVVLLKGIFTTYMKNYIKESTKKSICTRNKWKKVKKNEKYLTIAFLIWNMSFKIQLISIW